MRSREPPLPRRRHQRRLGGRRTLARIAGFVPLSVRAGLNPIKRRPSCALWVTRQLVLLCPGSEQTDSSILGLLTPSVPLNMIKKPDHLGF